MIGDGSPRHDHSDPGKIVGEVYRKQKIYAVNVWAVPEVRRDLDPARQCLIETLSGGHVPIGELAEITIEPAPNKIVRERASRRIDVTCNVRDRDLASVAQDIESQVKTVAFVSGYHREFLGEYAAQKASQRQLFLIGMLSMAGIALLPLIIAGTNRVTKSNTRWHWSSLADF